MSSYKTDIKADETGVRNDGEAVSIMEPLLLSENSRHRPILADLAVVLVAKSAGFYHSLPPNMASALSNLVRSMNCYYSNLIEGHNTHPVDIERALQNAYSKNDEK